GRVARSVSLAPARCGRSHGREPHRCGRRDPAFVRGTSRGSLMNRATAPSDSVADVIETPAKCPQCGAMTQLDHETCINCFLRTGLETKGEGSREAFESILVEA